MNASTGVTAMISAREKALVGKIAGNVYKRYCPSGIDGKMNNINFYENPQAIRKRNFRIACP
ncbi:MAG: hypothetical protein R6U27_09715 [Desulfobacterales bacterium]